MSIATQGYEPQADLSALVDHPSNPRRGDDAAVAQSIESNGFYGAILAQRSTGHILAGHTRRRTLTAAGQATGPVIWIDCDDDTARRILLADNRTAELATWDQAALIELLHELDPEELPGVAFTAEGVEVIQRQVDVANAGSLNFADVWGQAGTPGYASDDNMGAYQTSIHFATMADADAFFRQLDRPKSKRWWWPEPDGFEGSLTDSRVKASD